MIIFYILCSFRNLSVFFSLCLLFSGQRELKKPSIGKEYFIHKNLEAIVTNYPYRKNLAEEDIVKGYLPCSSLIISSSRRLN